MTQTTYETSVNSSFSGDLDSTLAGANFLAANVLDEYTTHTSLHKSINEYMLSKHASSEGAVDEASLTQAIVEDAHDLAAQILPQSVCDELEISAKIADNTSFHHPPSIEEVVLLGNSWDITKDEITLQAIRHSVEEISATPAETKVIREAVEKATMTNSSFMSSYLTAEANLLEKQNTVNVDSVLEARLARQATIFLDMSPHSPYAEDVQDLGIYAEENERLVQPVAVPFVEKENISTNVHGAEINDGTKIDYPRIEYYSKYDKNIHESRLKKLARKVIQKNAS